ncbi:MAG: type VI secretion system lipoprotein TssJ [Azoarcus sp.]|nr:type VI secretion system lipoprotein TssJ [Azoarcus sp.]
MRHIVFRLGFRSGLGLLAVAMLVASLASCASKKPKDPPPKPEEPFPRVEPMAIRGPQEFALKARADANVNRDINGKSLSIVVRIYQLKDKNEFARLAFDKLASGRGDTELFPTEFVAVRETVLIPGATQEVTEKLVPDARYVGVVGFFRKPDARGWRFLVDSGAVTREGLNFTVRDCYFDGIQPKPEPSPGEADARAPRCTSRASND